jgi:hypothetical protein
MDNKYLVKRALLDALGTTIYVFMISQIMSHGNQLFGKVENNFLAPMIFLLLFVFSALVTGYLILGKPIMLYVDGQKKEALRLFFYSGAFLLAFMLIGFIIILIGK